MTNPTPKTLTNATSPMDLCANTSPLPLFNPESSPITTWHHLPSLESIIPPLSPNWSHSSDSSASQDKKLVNSIAAEPLPSPAKSLQSWSHYSKQSNSHVMQLSIDPLKKTKNRFSPPPKITKKCKMRSKTDKKIHLEEPETLETTSSDDADDEGVGVESEDDDVDPLPKRKATEKEWFLPDMNEAFETYIDHGCGLDNQGYPIYPNGRTTFLRLPGDDVTNFGSVGFTKTSTVSYCSNKTWKKRRIKCRGLAGKCNGTVSHVTCPNKKVAIRFDHHLPSGWGLLRHKGEHPHPWPEAKKPNPLAKEELKSEIKKNPKAGALKLKMGKPTNPHLAFDSVVSIHPAYQNRDQLAYYRRCLLAELGLAPDKLGAGVGDKFILDMFGWALQGMWIILSSFMPMAEHFTFQTKWMVERLLARNKENQVYSGGLISDVTYWYFETGYLLTTSMYCNDLQRWIPVQLTWIRGLSEEYYKIHFATLFRKFLAASITPAERDTLVRKVVDFSAAQVEGFVLAYIEVFQQGTRKEVRGMLKGCRKHYRQSITRIKRNRALITVDQEEPFRKACMGLLNRAEPGGQSHEQKIDFIRRRFPKVRKWLDWWTVSDVEALLFPSRESRLEDKPDGLPETKNAQESMHRTYYHLSEVKQCLMVGMIDLFTFVDMLEKDWKAVMNGVQINYGGEKSKDIGLTLGMAKKRKRANKFVNDGRPPDTTDDLIDRNKKAKTGRPPNSRNFNKNLWEAYPSYRAACDNSQRANRCWLAAGLESFFIPGAFCSADYFLEVVLDPKLHLSPEYKKLFSIHKHRTFTCELKPDILQSHPDRANRSLHVLVVKPQMFDSNRIPYSDVAKLVETWQTSGLIGTSGLVCKECAETQPSTKAKSKPKKKGKLEKVSSEIKIYNNPGVLQQSAHYLIDRCKLNFDKVSPPLHLNFHLEVSSVDDVPRRDGFMATTNWPFKLNVGGATYTLISRGFWNGGHYWCKVLQSANISAEKGSLTAVWMHNDLENDGYAQQINRVPSSIAGAEMYTSWLLYSRTWTSSEEEYMNNSIQKIMDDNSDAAGDVPFREMKSILNISHTSTLIAHKELNSNNETTTKSNVSPEESTTGKKKTNRKKSQKKLVAIKETEEAEVESDVANILEKDDSFFDQTAGDKSIVANQTAGDESFNQTDVDQSFNQTAGDQLFNQTAGDQLFNQTAGDKSFNQTAGDKSFNQTARDESFKQTAGDKSFNQTAGDESFLSNQLLLDQSQETPTGTQVSSQPTRLCLVLKLPLLSKVKPASPPLPPESARRRSNRRKK
ncbi:hypothetical protein PTTG_25298 [Puccinia triticina 1-1 BBBD Race 1]|uniref:GCM domain-containing protein n=1 Tax=Puccinia triticina (isolate 1-1 / race 1 (BBBD)) TaxID=630390 RepID=A0A180H5T8_PUCT1|nr:hypothetical protein PTTG_25298 [Puccinia triticina 1-1 BBBD Race 1]